jgi:hypothetical protein
MAPIKQTVNATSNKIGEFMAEILLVVPKASVDTWWPNGFGAQKLYFLHVQWEDTTINDVRLIERKYWQSEKIVRVGFRTIKLVQETVGNWKAVEAYGKVG